MAGEIEGAEPARPDWERRKGEKAEEYKVFRTYRGTPGDEPIRDFSALSTIHGVDKGRLREMAVRLDWAERSRKWDLYVDRQFSLLHREEIRQIARSNVRKKLDAIREIDEICEKLLVLIRFYGEWPRERLVTEDRTPDGAIVVLEALVGAGGLDKLAVAYEKLRRYGFELRDELRGGADVVISGMPSAAAEIAIEALGKYTAARGLPTPSIDDERKRWAQLTDQSRANGK